MQMWHSLIKTNYNIQITSLLKGTSFQSSWWQLPWPSFASCQPSFASSLHHHHRHHQCHVPGSTWRSKGIQNIVNDLCLVMYCNPYLGSSKASNKLLDSSMFHFLTIFFLLLFPHLHSSKSSSTSHQFIANKAFSL